MKNIVLFIVSFSLWFNLLAQDFAPVGALWHFNERSPFTPDIGYLTVHSIEEVMFQGKLCRKLLKNHGPPCMPRPSIEYVYSENGVVYFWDPPFNEFQILYDFNTPVDSFWTYKVINPDLTYSVQAVLVNSISYVTINNQTLKVMNVRYYRNIIPYFCDHVIWEKLGEVSCYMFEYISTYFWGCDVEYPAGLRCYDDPTFGFYTTNPAIPCTFVNTGLPDCEINPQFQLFPNPAKDHITLTVENTEHHRNIELRCFNLLGMQQYQTRVQRGQKETTLNVSAWPPGMYVAVVYSDGRPAGRRKFVVK